tara:strand:+ start:508 stop:738 length:231 start_codon:yes stop_codon:yes gene_type:complete
VTFEEAYRRYEQLTVELSQTNDTMELAGAMMGQAMKLYKMVLTPDEFDALMIIISKANELDDTSWPDDETPSGTIH